MAVVLRTCGSRVGAPSVSKHTMYVYLAIKERFKQRKQQLRDQGELMPTDFTMDWAARRIADLEAQVGRFEETNSVLLDQFRRWQYNAYAHNVRMETLNLDIPLPVIDRSRGR